jgi:hypothetical protein
MVLSKNSKRSFKKPFKPIKTSLRHIKKITKVSFLEELWYKYSFNRISRIRYRINDDLIYARNHLPRPILKKIEDYDDELETIANKLRKLTFAKVVTVVCLYASVMYAAVSEISLLASALQIAQFLGGVIGSTVLLILLAGLNRLTNVYLSDAHIASSYIIAKVMYYREKKNAK